MMRLSLLVLLSALLACTVFGQTQQVQFGYSYQCPPATLDYPCLTTLVGTATINTTQSNLNLTGTLYPYYPILSFTGLRTFYTRFGTVFTTNATLAPLAEIGATNRLVLNVAALGSSGPTFRLNSTIQFPGGLFGNEVRVIVTTGYATESIAFVGNSATNSLNADPTTWVFCSTAPGFVASAYNTVTEAAAFSTSMAPCQAGPTFNRNFVYTTAQQAPGLQQFIFTYSITDSVSFAAQVTANVVTDGTINYDSLGNLYYNLITISGTRSEQSLLNVSAQTTVFISSLMAPNIIATSNIAYITNNNRIYPQYPFLDRYGIAYTVTSVLGTVTQPELEDGSISSYTDVVGAYIYRSDTLDEQGLDGLFAYPPFNINNTNQNSLTLTSVPVPAVYQLIQFCYVIYGLPNTLDYPWSVVFNGTGLINNTLGIRNVSNTVGISRQQPVYTLLGFVGLRNYTNRFGVSLVNAVTFDQLGEDANVGLLTPVSPYAVTNSVSFHLNGTIQTPGGLLASDLSFFANPYPIEGTGYGIGIGTSTNALNNDPAKTVFVSNMPGFQPNTYSNSNPATMAGNVTGTTDLSQCRASFQTVARPGLDVTATGLRALNLVYNLTAANNANVYANLMIITDGTVNQDQLGNYYYTALGIFGYRVYYNMTGFLISNTTVTALTPIGGNIANAANDIYYTNNNRIYPNYPFVDRLGLSYQEDVATQVEGSTSTTPSSNLVGLITYRHVVVEEVRGAGATFSPTPAGINLTVTQNPTVAAQYFNFSWGYVMYCPNTALEYPCAVSVQGTALAVINSVTQSQCTTDTYTPLCNGTAYQMVGFTGTRTITNRYGEKQIAYLSLQPFGEDYADNLVYLAQPYVDGDGPTFRLNGTDQIPTEVIGGQVTNEINVFLNPYPTEGIAYSGANPSAIIYNNSMTVICSTMPGFQPGTYSPTSGVVTGNSSMAACLPKLPTLTRPTFVDSVTPTQYTFAYSVSDGATFTVQTQVSITTDGRAYVDTLGNRYVLATAATGTRTYYTYGVASLTAQSVQTASITGLAPVGSIIIHNNVLTGNRTTNRLYPFQTPFIDALGIGFTLAVNTTATGTGGRAQISTFAVYQYKDATIEEYPTGGSFPTPAYQQAAIANGAVNNLTSTLTVTAPTLLPSRGYLCVILYSLPGTIDYPWSSATSVNFFYTPQSLVERNGNAVQILSGTGARTYTNRFGDSTTTPLTLAGTGTDFADNLLYLNSNFPVDTAGLTWNLSNPVQLPNNGAASNRLQYQINVYNTSAGVLTEQYSQRIDPLGQAFLSNIPGFLNITIGPANINALAPNYATCQAPITFTNGLRTPTEAGAANSAQKFLYTYTISDCGQAGGATWVVQANLTITATTQFASQQDALGNPYQVVRNLTGTRTYTYLPTGQQIVSNITGLATLGSADQRFYSYALLNSAPGAYTINTAPFLDTTGIAYTYSPSAPSPGRVPTYATQYTTTTIHVYGSVSSAFLEEYRYIGADDSNVNCQQQSYTFLPYP